MDEKVEEQKESEQIETGDGTAGAAAGEEDAEDVSKMDENVFKQNTDIFETSQEQEFQVTNPQNKGGHIVYKCKGVDNMGNWEGERRYNEFFKLHQTLEMRWPGVPIPTLPPKKAIGNKDIKFINERRFYLERFMKKMAPFDFVTNSVEFKNFSRPQGDVEKLLSSLPKMSAVDITERLKESLKIQEHMYNPIQKEQLDRECKEFQHFARQIVPLMREMQKKIAIYMQNKSQSIQNYKILMTMLDKYEELNLANYVEGKEEKMVFGNTQYTNSDGLTLKDGVVKMNEGLKNPYFNLYHWCKGELFDIEAVYNAINTKDKILERVGKTEKKKSSAQKDLDNVTTGRKTVKTLFKNQSDTGGMVSKIENTEKELESMNVLHDILTIYLGETVVPEFKGRKFKIYSKIIQQFNVMQINNAHQVASFWSQILSNPNIKSAAEEGSKASQKQSEPEKEEVEEKQEQA